MKFKKILTIGISAASLDKEYWEKIDALADQRVELPKESPEINKELSDADCLLVAFGIPVTKEMISSAPSLKYIGVLATAYGKIDIAHAKEKSIPVANLAGYSTEAVAEFSLAALLESIRHLETGKQRGRAGVVLHAGEPAIIPKLVCRREK